LFKLAVSDKEKALRKQLYSDREILFKGRTLAKPTFPHWGESKGRMVLRPLAKGTKLRYSALAHFFPYKKQEILTNISFVPLTTSVILFLLLANEKNIYINKIN
jgi:hypothetical protein